VEVTFPAFKNSAECKDPTTGTVLWTFHRRASGLYEAEVRETAAALHPSSAAANSAPPIHPTTILHQRLGHMGVGSMRTVISAQSIKGLPATFVAPPRPFATDCLPCIQGKTQAAPHPLVLKRATRRGEKLHVDLVGPMPTSSIRGHRYCLTIVECFSRKKFTILLHTKAQARTKIIEFINMVECKTKLKVEHLHGDRGREFFNDALLSYLDSRGTTYSFSNPDSPQQNGVAEAANKTVLQIARTLLEHSQAPRNLWGYAVLHATDLANLLPHHQLGGKTPQEMWSGEKPSVHRLRVWGSTGHVLLNKNERRRNGGKLGPVTKPCVLVGHNPIGPGWLLLDGDSLREVPSSDVAFQEHVPFYSRQGAEGNSHSPGTTLTFSNTPEPTPHQWCPRPKRRAPLVYHPPAPRMMTTQPPQGVQGVQG